MIAALFLHQLKLENNSNHSHPDGERMDTRVVSIPKLSHLLLLGLPVFFVPLHGYAAETEQFLCGGTQASKNELPQLNSDCPIGTGLWGKSKPKGKDSTFWIQCGLLNNPMPLSRAKILYQHISTDVWMKAEGKAMRCLIGPYNDYAIAKKELSNVRTEKIYKEAFIREVRKGVKDSAMVKPVANKKTAPVTKSTPKTTTIMPAVKKAPVVPPSSPSEDQSSMVSIRRQATVNGLKYAVPYVMDSKIQFYMEHELAWNRLNYQDAQAICKQQKMRLATEQEWLQLLDSKVMEKDNWPVYLPYWGADNKGLFTTGKINTLKGTSLLNVLCVK